MVCFGFRFEHQCRSEDSANIGHGEKLLLLLLCIGAVGSYGHDSMQVSCAILMNSKCVFSLNESHFFCRGFVPGQSIPITAEVNNHSNVKVDTLRVILRKRIEFRTQFPRVESRIEKATINEFALGPIGTNDSKTLAQSIEIPPLPPTNMENCGIIKVDYEIKVCI